MAALTTKTTGRRVLLLARHFPPIGGAGVHRTLGTVRHLPENGWQATVVTGPAEHVDRWNPRDAALLAHVPAAARVRRAPGPEPAGRSGRRERLGRLTHTPEPWIRWWAREAVSEGLTAGADADVILASCVPYETAWAAARLSRELGIPWVADLEDPWSLDEMAVEPTIVNAWIARERMQRALRTAEAVILTAPEAARRMRAALRVSPPAGIHAIPIGFEPGDAPPAAAQEPHERVLRIVHTGSLHTELGLRHRRTRTARRLLGGTSLDVDILTRSAAVLIPAVEDLLRRRPDLDVEIVLAGDLTAADRALAAGRPFVHLRGLLPHDETLRLMRSADLLFLPLYDVPPGSRAGLIPYKLYEYLAAERPILAAVPDGDVRDLLAPVRHATLCRPADRAGMAAAIEAAADRAQAQSVEDGIDSPALAGLRRDACVAEIAAVLDAAAGRRGQEAGAPRRSVARSR